MTMEPTITCAALIEPRTNIAPANAVPVGLQINFELLAKPVKGENPEQAFHDFFAALPGLTFAVYGYIPDTSIPNKGILVKRADIIVTEKKNVDDASAEPIIKWLKEWRNPDTTDRTKQPPWFAALPTDGELHDPAALSAGQRLASAQGWVAPLPQQAGLTRMLYLKKLNITSSEIVNLYVIPFRATDYPLPDKIPNVTQSDGTPVDHQIEFDHPFSWGKVKAAPLLAAGKDGTLVIDETGFLRANSDDAQAIALMNRIRARAGTLFWTAPHLASLEMPAGGSHQERGERLIWRAAATLSSLFDPLFLALSMASDQRREGPFLAAAAIAIVEEGPALFGKIGEVQDGFVARVSDWVKKQSDVDMTDFIKLAAELSGNTGLAAKLSGDSGLTAAQLYDQIAGSVELLPVLLALAALKEGRAWPNSVDFGPLEARLSAELGALVRKMGSEGGIEAAVLAFFRHKDHGRPMIEELFLPVRVAPEVPAGKREAAEAKAKAKVDAVLGRIAARLGDNFDGLAAARIATGSLFAERVPQIVEETKLPADFASMFGHVKRSQWFAQRAFSIKDLPFGNLLEYMRKPVNLQLDTEAKKRATGALDAAFNASCDDLVVGLDVSKRRFIPDTDPQPLPVRLTIDTDTGDSDVFDQCYDGVGVLLQRGNKGWAHANLARLTKRIPNGEPIENVGPTILPLLPATVDGERQLALAYDGRTFAANDAPLVGEDVNPSEQVFEPYHSHRALLPDEFGKHRKLPALAYGTLYQTASYAVSRSGVLPAGVGATDDWLKPAIDPSPPKEPGYVAEHRYSRTTAIGRVGLDRARDDRAFAAPVQRIELLSTDYPRIGMTCIKGATRFLDLWRTSDGTGAIPLPEVDKSIKLTLADVLISGSAPITVSLQGDPAVMDATECLSLKAVMDATECLSLEAEKFSGKVDLTLKRTSSNEVTLTVAGEKTTLTGQWTSAWVRLAFVAPSDNAAVRLADPAGAIQGGVAGAGTPGAATLVLRPTGGNWSADFATEAKATVRFPAMGRIDMDRWLENTRLHEEAAAKFDRDRFKNFRTDLIAASLDLGLAKKIEPYLGALPDLAVTGLLAELTILDNLGDTDFSRAVTPLVIPIKKLGDYLQELIYQNDKLPAFLNQLREKHCVSVTVTAGKNVSLEEGLVATVPAGHTARLSFLRLVPKNHFISVDGNPPVLAEGLRQFAVGRHNDCLVFDGPSLTVEVMNEVERSKLKALADSALSVVAEGTARRYRLQLNPAELTPEGQREWRGLGSAEVAEQRWRFLGWPIHNWFKPKSARHPLQVGNPAAVVWMRDDDAIRNFESEAFDPHATPQRQSTLLRPLGEISVLSSVDWPDPSATLFRHQLTVRSRYAGAQTKPETLIVVGGKDKDWLRVAVLAERSRIELTRPQLRALLPLNRAPDDGLTPPLLALLSERPFAQGGLADRIASGVVTGLGYALSQESSEQKLSIGDARQEFGPDPQLSYHPLPNKLSLAMTLTGEGPIGLTFDSLSAPAPAFANSAWVLAPEALRADPDPDPDLAKPDWQEHFVSVTMRRYLDPEWIADSEPKPKMDKFAFGETVWFELKEPTEIECGSDTLLSVKKSDNNWTVEIASKALLLPESTDKGTDKQVKLVDVNAPDIGLALLHQPLEAGRAALSVFAIKNTGTELPRLIAGCEWRCNPSSDLALKIKPEADNALRTSASAPTAMEWARTGRNAEKLMVREENAENRWPARQLDIGDLRMVKVKADADTVTFQTGEGKQAWICSSLTTATNPLYVHRVLALLQTNRLATAQATETFGSNCYLVFGKEARFPGLDQSGKESGKVGRLVELELPARPLGATAPQLPPEFATAQFDLAETFASTTDPEAYLLMVRPLPGQIQGENVTLTATFWSKQVVTVTLPKQEKGQDPAAMFLIMIKKGFAEYTAWFVNGNGNVLLLSPKPKPLIDKQPSDDQQNKNVMTLAAACTQEWWADVSMLTLAQLPDSAQHPDSAQRTPHIKLDFNWLFGNDNPALEEALGHENLRKMVSAQARLISVTPPLAGPV
jgi:hypothetical protein